MVSVAVIVAIPMVPMVSRAVTVSTFKPSWRGMPLTVQFVVPAAVPLPPRLFDHVTRVTPRLADAVPASVIGELLVV